MALFYQLNTGRCILEYVKLKQNEGVIEFISKLRSAATDDHIFFGMEETYQFINFLIFDENHDSDKLVGLGHTQFAIIDCST
jgi:hypothetical protein